MSKTIPQLDVGTLGLNSLFETAQVNSGSSTGYDSTKVSASDIGTFAATQQNYSELNTTAKTLVGAINEAAQGGGSSTLAGLSDVHLDDLAEYDLLQWDGVEWVNISKNVIIDEAYGQVAIHLLLDTYDENTSYVVGDYVYNLAVGDNIGVPYRCIAPTTGAWDSTKWQSVLLADEITRKAEYTEVSGTLSAGSTSITLSNAAITANSTIDIYTSIFGVDPTAVTVSTGSVTLTFEAQASNLDVKVRIS